MNFFRWGAIVLASLVYSSTLHAGSWQVCKLNLTIQHPGDERGLQAKVDNITASQDALNCPKRGEVIRFTPETSDYQSLLPRKKWPGIGTKARWRYIYLNGFRKNDGNSGPCIIEHYPKGWG